jgi:hypothetical protein
MKILPACLVLAASATPVLAQMQPRLGAEPLNAGSIVQDAALFPKVVLILLAIATIAALVILVRKLLAGPNLAGGSAYLSGLRAGGPLLGLIGAGYGLMNSGIGVATVGPVPLHEVMPGLIESLFLAIAGLVVGLIAIVAHWAVEARIDRQVLRS